MTTSVNTFGWDTAFGTTFAVANRAIAEAGGWPGDYSGSYVDPLSRVTAAVSAHFGTWSLSGGSGGLVHLSMPLTGEVVPSDGQALAFAGRASVEVQLAFLPQPGAADTRRALMLDRSLPVTVLDVALDEGSTLQQPEAVRETLQTWLDGNLEVFTHVFASLDLNARADQAAFQWLAPTHVGYAVYTEPGRSVDDSVFGVLAMTEGRSPQGLAHEIDARVVPADGRSNSGFLIAPERIIDKVLLPNIAVLFDGATADCFDTQDDGLTITNSRVLRFQSFELDDGRVVDDVQVAAGGFQLDIFSSSIRLKFDDLTFTWKEGFNVHLDYLGVGELTVDATNRFRMKETSAPTVDVIVSKTRAEEWKEIGEGIAIGVGAAVAGALIGGALGEAADSAAESGAEAAQQGGQDAVNGLTEDVEMTVQGVPDEQIPNDDELVAEEDDEAADELEDGGQPGRSAKFKGWFRRNWRKLLGSAVGSVVGGGAGAIPSIVRAYGQDELKDMPTLDAFMGAAAATTTWPTVSGYAVVSGKLSGAFQMGFELSQAAAKKVAA